jgi:hypothetical protein
MPTKEEINAPVHTTPPPMFEVAGTHREIGQQIGEAAKKQVQHSVENARILLDSAYEQVELTWDGAIIQSRKYMPFAQERFPQYVDELMGIAEGAGVTFDQLAVVNAMERPCTGCPQRGLGTGRRRRCLRDPCQAEGRTTFPGDDLRRAATQHRIQRLWRCPIL